MISQEERRFLEAPELAPVKEFVGAAFREVAKSGRGAAGGSFQYSHILQQLRQRDDPEMLWRIYISLADFVVQIAHRPDTHRDLLQNLFSFDWNAGDNIVVAYVHLLGLLVSANPSFVPPVAQLIVRNLTADGTNSSSRHARLHATLKSVMALSPGGQAGLFSALADLFPYKTQGRDALVVYVRELLFICEYLPHFQQRILDLIVTKCIEIDVDISTESVNLDTEHSNSLNRNLEADDMFCFDEDNKGENETMVGFGEESHTRGGGGLGVESSRSVSTGASDLADALDGMLCVLLRFVEAQFAHRDSSVRERSFMQLLGIFERRVLTTHRSKFVQFIVFYMCMKHSEYSGTFCRRLLDIFANTKSAAGQRHCAVMYLASFCCRSLSCAAVTIRNGIFELLLWVKHYGELNEKDAIGDIERELSDASEKLFVVGKGGVLSLKHDTLYLVVQAICYVLCFHGDGLWLHFLSLDGEAVGQFLSVLSVFRPLQFARSDIRSEFIQLLSRTAGASAKAGMPVLHEEWGSAAGVSDEGLDRGPDGGGMDLIDCSGGNASMGLSAAMHLEYVFPFDPCLLRGTRDFVVSGYQNRRDLQGSYSSNRFDGISAPLLPTVRGHAESEDDLSSSTSLMLWPGQAVNDGELSSYESSLMSSVAAGRTHDFAVSGAADALGKEVPGGGQVIPPRPPLAGGNMETMGTAAAAGDNRGDEWTPAPLSRQRRRNRRKIEESPESSPADVIEHQEEMTNTGFSGIPHDSGGKDTHATSTAFQYPNIFAQRVALTRPTSGAGAVPTFDNFAVPAVPIRDSSSGNVGAKHSPALNDFQKRAREYSVGSVGSW